MKAACNVGHSMLNGNTECTWETLAGLKLLVSNTMEKLKLRGKHRKSWEQDI
jgi:hypothetical protein